MAEQNNLQERLQEEELQLIKSLVARLNIKLHDINCVAHELGDLLAQLVAARIRSDGDEVDTILDQIIQNKVYMADQYVKKGVH